MGQSSSQPDYTANENITSPKQEEVDSAHTSRQVLGYEFPFVSAQVPPPSQEPANLKPLSHPDPIAWSSSIGYPLAEDNILSNQADRKDKIKDSLAMPHSTMESRAEHRQGERKEKQKKKKRKRRRSDTENQKPEQINGSMGFCESNEEGNLPPLKQRKTADGRIALGCSTAIAESYPRTPTQSKKQRKKLKEKVKAEHTGSSIPIDRQSSIVESPVFLSSSIPNYSEMTKTQKTNAKNRLRKRLKREGDSVISVQSPTPINQPQPSAANDRGALSGAGISSGAVMQSDAADASRQQAPSGDTANGINGLSKSPRRRRKKKQTTVSELTDNNLNSQSFKSARIKHEQDRESIRPPLDTGRQNTTHDEAPVESSIDNSVAAESHSQNTSDEEENVQEETLDEQLQGKPAVAPSPVSIVESSRRSSSQNLHDSVQEEQVEEDDVQFMPTEELSEEEEPIDMMDSDPQSDTETSIHNGSATGEVLDEMDTDTHEDANASSTEDNSASIEKHLAKSTQNDRKRHNNKEDMNGLNEIHDPPPSKKIRLESSTSSTSMHQSSSHNDTDQSTSESASSEPALPQEHHNARSPKTDSMLANGKKQTAQIPRTNPPKRGKKRAFKSAEMVIDSEDENVTSKHDIVDTRDPISTHDIHSSDEDEVRQPKSISDSLKTPRRLPVIQRKEPATPAIGKNSASRTPKRQVSSAVIPAGQRKNGPFEDYEITQLNDYQERWCTMNRMSEHDFRLKVHENAHNSPTVQNFWSEMQESLTNRDRKSLQRFCRRRWPQAENKGAFSEEDDRQLIKLVALHGPQWVKLSEHLGYTPEAIRDHYRNVVKDQSTRNIHSWNDEETLQLRHVMGQLGIELLQKSFSVEEIPKYITWTIVSEKMDGQRNRSQCAYKWKRLIAKNITTLGKEIWSANTRLGLDVDLADIDLAGVEMADDSIMPDHTNNVEAASATP